MMDMIEVTDDREALLSLLAKKLEANPKAVSFLFGQNRDDERSITIPDFRTLQD